MDLSKQLIKIISLMKCTFYFKDKIISLDDMFKETGLLPGLAKRADQLCSLCLGYGIGVNFEDAEDALLSRRVIFDDVTPNLLRILCIIDVLNEIVKSSSSRERVALDELLYD
ncbi:MAG: type IV secretion IcmS family protein [Pseudomonadota bacterium]